jgi:hypothetical protein
METKLWARQRVKIILEANTISYLFKNYYGNEWKLFTITKHNVRMSHNSDTKYSVFLRFFQLYDKISLKKKIATYFLFLILQIISI